MRAKSGGRDVAVVVQSRASPLLPFASLVPPGLLRYSRLVCRRIDTTMLRIIASGVLLLPAALVMIVTVPVVALLSLPAAALLTFRKKKDASLEGGFRRAIVTGGSSGIGLAVAGDCVKKGFDEVVIIARNVDKLEAAKKSLQKHISTEKGTKITALSVDVSNLGKLEEAAAKIFDKDTEKTSTYLFCCAGQATPCRFNDLSEEVILHNSRTNHLGATFTVRAMLPHMKAGTIMLCSSVSLLSHVERERWLAYCRFVVVQWYGTADGIENDDSHSLILHAWACSVGGSSGSLWIRGIYAVQICACRFGPGPSHGTV